MIIKTKKYHRDDYIRLVNYILNQDKADRGRFSTIYHNLHSTDIKTVIDEFKANDKYRKLRQRGIVCYQEIIGFSPKDSKYITKEILEDIAARYIQLRGDLALCIAEGHFDKDSKHIHFLFSGTEYKSSKTLRLERKDFKGIRTQMEAFQKERYPFLTSLVYEKWEKAIDREIEKEKIRGFSSSQKVQKGVSKEDALKTILKELQEKYPEGKEFQEQLKAHPEIEVYLQRGREAGILFLGQKFRWKRLEIEWGKKDRKLDRNNLNTLER